MTRKGQLTTPRKTILEVICASHSHPTAAEVMERLKERGANFAYATVYNSLRYLTEEGLIRELKLEGDASRYDGCLEIHHHVVCTECGRVDEVFAHVPENWLEQVSGETGYRIDQEQVLFKGVCPQCRNKKAQQP